MSNFLSKFVFLVLRFVFSLYSIAFYFALLLAAVISSGGLSQVQKEMMPYGIAILTVAMVVALGLAIFKKPKFGNEVTRKKEGYVFYFKSAPFIIPILFIAIGVVATWLAIMLFAGDVTEEVFFSFYLWVGPIGLALLICYYGMIKRWSVVYASDINNITVKFAKFELIPWTSNINPAEIREVVFRTLILETGSKTSSDAKLKKTKDEIDELAKGFTVQSTDMVEFIDRTKKMYPGMAIILERIILKSHNGKKTPIVLNEKSDFKSFVNIFFKGRKPMIIWKSRMMY